jgi:hypothetical protein
MSVNPVAKSRRSDRDGWAGVDSQPGPPIDPLPTQSDPIMQRYVQIDLVTLPARLHRPGMDDASCGRFIRWLLQGAIHADPPPTDDPLAVEAYLLGQEMLAEAEAFHERKHLQARNGGLATQAKHRRASAQPGQGVGRASAQPEQGERPADAKPRQDKTRQDKLRQDPPAEASPPPAPQPPMPPIPQGGRIQNPHAPSVACPGSDDLFLDGPRMGGEGDPAQDRPGSRFLPGLPPPSLADLQVLFPALIILGDDRERAHAILRLYEFPRVQEALTALVPVAAARPAGKRRIFIAEVADWLAKHFQPDPDDYRRAGLPVPISEAKP